MLFKMWEMYVDVIMNITVYNSAYMQLKVVNLKN